MNPETHFLIDRPYREVVEDILTAIIGGIVNEPIEYDIKSDFYPLAQPALDLRRVTGLLDDERYTFQRAIDYQFSEGDNALVWEEGGKQPDDETTFYVDYFGQESSSPLSDINVGSVTRTLSEAIGREIATVYEQINLAYRSGFIDSAQGKALDLVVSILGVTRKTKDFAVGLNTFFRNPASTGNITIPQGVRLATKEGEVLFETTEPRTLQRGQLRIEAPIRAGEEFKGEVGKVAVDEITVLVQPIEGIDRITNLEPTILSAEDETDEQLRGRARARLRSLGKATIPALIRVVIESRAVLLEVRDPASPAIKRTLPGTVDLLVETEPEKLPALRDAVNQTRAAGVLANVIARYIFFKPRMVVILNEVPGTGPGKAKIIEEIIAEIRTYAESLSSGEDAEGAKILEAVENVEEVAKNKTRIVDVLAWRTNFAEPGADEVVNSLLRAIESSAPDESEALRENLNKTLTEEISPFSTGARIPDRGLVQGTNEDLTGDAIFEAGDFKVVADTDWWVVLDMDAADVVLRGES